ncbi:hypothetical protein UA45_21260, partial [Morganella morganii]
VGDPSGGQCRAVYPGRQRAADFHCPDAGCSGKIAGCRRIILCSPPPVADEILYAAQLCGVETIYQVGGAQAIAAMAFGTETIPATDKIFGPGNAYVTEAKRQVSQTIGGAAIDMPAGPSEVLVIADSGANPAFVAADLLSQAEHGPDSQVVLVTPDEAMAQRVVAETNSQLELLSRKEIARQALSASRIIIARDLDTCVAISNQYGPEHLIIQTRDPDACCLPLTVPVPCSSVTGRRNRRVIMPPAPTTSCRLTVIPRPIPASDWRIL